jgi:hypothetical protein
VDAIAVNQHPSAAHGCAIETASMQQDSRAAALMRDVGR